jgi:inner membrane protein
VDNLAHAFTGAVIAECALPPGAPPAWRRVFLVAGVLAASLPDFDLVYTGIVEAPLGYMLHHRGHTHTWPGLLALGLLLLLALRFWPAARQVMAEARSRLLWVIAAASASHLLMDAANSYGTHLFYPFTSAWYYGDAVFILEPWAWVLPGVALAMNARGRVGRWLVLLLTVAPIAGLTYIGLVAPLAAAALLAGGLAMFAFTRQWQPGRRAAAALVAILALFLGLAGLSRLADSTARPLLAGHGGGELLDLVLDPNPAAPWCWSFLTVERSAPGPAEELLSRRGTLSLLPSILPAERCAGHRLFLAQAPAPALVSTTPALAFRQEWRSDLAALRERAAGDCRTAAWLQFGRAPWLGPDQIADLRYENPMRGNFSAMTLRPPSPDCPPNLTGWEKPRRDLFGP